MKNESAVTASGGNGVERRLREIECVALDLTAQGIGQCLGMPCDCDEVRRPALQTLAHQTFEQAAPDEPGRARNHDTYHDATPCISTQAGFEAAEAHQAAVTTTGIRSGPNAVATRVHTGCGPASANRPFFARL